MTNIKTQKYLDLKIGFKLENDISEKFSKMKPVLNYKNEPYLNPLHNLKREARKISRKCIQSFSMNKIYIFTFILIFTHYMWSGYSFFCFSNKIENLNK